MVEAAIVLPLLIFFLLGVFDLGFYLYAYVSIGDAARVAALDTAASSLTAANSALACADVRSDLQSLINSSSFSSTCATGPLTVSAHLVNGPDGAAATLVAVQYSLPLLQFPWLPNTFNATGFAEMRVRGQ
ncbi:MAG TPA: TadE/TadG family type IV pilus assembly protein [Bryobacteraceae bacterium]|jgi:Flp pilus assembly protein TadG|nr:TadE/TadG family type IV pilus assembly protein [Bryobacteraceae bacterium]